MRKAESRFFLLWRRLDARLSPQGKKVYEVGRKITLRWENLTIFLGYDPVECKHKVMCMPFRRSSDVCRMLTLGSAQEKWRSVKTKPTHRSDSHTSGRCIKGVIYYIAYVYRTSVWVIMSFDVRSEKFGMIQLPSDVMMNRIIAYEGRIAFVRRETKKDAKMTLRILEYAEKVKWSSKGFLAPIWYRDESLNTSLYVRGITHAGEFIDVPDTYHKPSYILFCDPVRSSFRRFELGGIMEDKAVVNTLYFHKLHAFPNHFENQMSL
ncbi:PREDICTED: putative F-box protein At1g47765 [Camelina sativa]|uniref:F-box protein At1g47765 n=1 Tax=Camelina sativa TaxID=90675 RepID=A0ABM1QWI8_CAMSA|nr:PREDICTED: putative F-box protein At1g47765 [Camelina sativa]